MILWHLPANHKPGFGINRHTKLLQWCKSQPLNCQLYSEKASVNTMSGIMLLVTENVRILPGRAKSTKAVCKTTQRIQPLRLRIFCILALLTYKKNMPNQNAVQYWTATNHTGRCPEAQLATESGFLLQDGDGERWDIVFDFLQGGLWNQSPWQGRPLSAHLIKS